MEELRKYLEEKKKEYAHNISNLPFNIRMERHGRIKAYNEIINYIDNVKTSSMEQIQRIIMPNGTIVGVDFGHGEDVCVKTTIKRGSNGTISILSQEIFGKSKEFVDDKDRIEYIDNIKNK